MQNNILIKYMEQRHDKNVVEKNKNAGTGPVITISRETGCPAKRIAKLLALSLNKRKENINWKCISKEILTESAKELELNPSQIQYVFDYGTRSAWDEIFQSLSAKYYKSDRKIRRAIASVIRSIAENGNVIIIGRGSIAITRDMPKSLHIYLQAPLIWRAEMLCLKHGFKTVKDAMKYAIDIDKKREKFRNAFYGKNTDYTLYDVTFNCMGFTDDEIVGSIIKIMELRKLI